MVWIKEGLWRYLIRLVGKLILIIAGDLVEIALLAGSEGSNIGQIFVCLWASSSY